MMRMHMTLKRVRVRVRVWAQVLPLLYAAAAGAAGEADEPYGMQGVQLSLGGHYAIEDFSRGEVLSADDSAGVSARVGFRLHRNFSLDANVDFSTGFDVAFPPSSDPRDDDDTVETGAFTLAARGILPFGRFQPYLSLGLGVIVVDTNEAGSEEVDAAGRFAGGIDIYINRWLGVNLRSGYTLPLGHLNGFKYGMVGGGVFVVY